MIETGVATMPTVKPLEERVARLKDRLKNDLVILGVIYTCYIFWGGPAMNEACNKRAPLGTSSVARNSTSSFFKNEDDYRVTRFKHLGTKQGISMEDIKRKLWKKKART